MDDGSLGVYLHVPFCERICPYCDFPVVAARPLVRSDEEAYVGALLEELGMRRPVFAGRRLESVYLGGGTPSLLHPDSVARLIRACCDAFSPAPDLEVTLEANPSTTERSRLPGFRAAGVNRLSLGIQSFQDLLLKRLGRAHRAAEGRASLAAARAAGFENVSLDLVFGAPGESLELLDRDLDEVLGVAPEHVSAYELTIEPGTPFALAERRGQLARPLEEVAVRMFQQVGERLEAAGIGRYEISNFAQPGRASAHNRRYWERRPVLGLGVGAWSSEPPDPLAPFGARRANRRDLRGYLECVRAGRSPASGPLEILGEATARGEAVFLALRTVPGLEARRFAQEFGAPPRTFFEVPIEELGRAGLLEESPAGDLRLTQTGLLLSDSVFEHFVEIGDSGREAGSAREGRRRRRRVDAPASLG